MAVASRSLDKANELAQKWDIPLTFGSYEAILASPKIDVVYIPLPNGMHYEWAVKAAQAGKHILCEKPLALTVAEVDEMTRAAQENGIVLLEAVMYQTHPQLAKLKSVIQEGLIGNVKLIQAYFSFTLPDRPENFRLNKVLGGGSLWDVGCYPVSFANAIAGGLPGEVSAYQQTDANGIDVIFAGQMKYPNGIIAQFTCGFQTAYRVGAEVIGDKGTIQIPQPWQPDTDNKTSGLIHIAPDDTQTIIPTEVIDPYFCQIQVMERAILDDVAAPYTLAQSRINIATINALYEAAEREAVIKIAN
jgi:predicted dehydrogenase